MHKNVAISKFMKKNFLVLLFLFSFFSFQNIKANELTNSMIEKRNNLGAFETKQETLFDEKTPSLTVQEKKFQEKDDEDYDEANINESESDEVNTKEESSDSSSLGFDINDLYEKMMSSLSGENQLSFSDAFNLLSRENGSGFVVDQTSKYDMANTSLDSMIDFGKVNLQYSALKNNMNTDFSIDKEEYGKSTDCVALFNQTYGNVLEQNKLKKAKLPDGWSANKMVKKSKKTINKKYNKTINNSDFQNIKKNISASSIFAQAKSGPKTTTLKTSKLKSTKVSEKKKKEVKGQILDNTNLTGESGAKSKYEEKKATYSNSLSTSMKNSNFLNREITKSYLGDYNQFKGWE